MSKLEQKLKQLPLIKKLNQFYAMPIIWWALLVVVLPFLFSLLRIPVVFRVGLLFMLVNSIISYHVGKLISKMNLKHWWLLLLPLTFCGAMLVHFAKYNLIFGVIYLIFEIFGLMDKQVYLGKRSD